MAERKERFDIRKRDCGKQQVPVIVEPGAQALGVSGFAGKDGKDLLHDRYLRRLFTGCLENGVRVRKGKGKASRKTFENNGLKRDFLVE